MAEKEQRVTAPRSRRLTVSMREDAYQAVRRAADDMGLSVSSWSAYTLASAAASQGSMREKMTESMVTLLREAIAEGEADGTLPK